MNVAVDQLGAAEGVDREQVDDSATPGAPIQPGAHGEPPRSEGRRRAALVVGGLTALVALPLALALVALRDPRWYPLVDMAQIEMRVRDVGLAHPPLLGLGGRIFGLETQGNHPGPIAFYLMAPVYRLLGSTAWALQVAGAVSNVVAIATAVWIARRRAGTRGALAAAGGLAFLVHFYGLGLLTTPWNPYFPMLWWVVFLLAVWSVLCRDLPLLPVAVVAGTIPAQTHLPYVGLIGGLAALVIVALVAEAVRNPERRARLARWSAASAGVALVLWLPSVVEQLGGRSGSDAGNVSIIVDSVRNPVEPTLGLGNAWDLWLALLDPLTLVGGRHTPSGVTGSQAGGLALLGVWLVSVAVATRLGPEQAASRRGLLRLHLVVGVAVVLGLISIGRIAGVPWAYLTLWGRGTAMVTLAAVVATAAFAAAPRLRRHRPRPDDDGAAAPPARATWWWLPGVALGALVLVPVTATALDAPDTTVSDDDVDEKLAQLAPPVVAALTGDDGANASRATDAPYLVTWHDPFGLGTPGFALLLELERQGVDAGIPPDSAHTQAVRDHRTLDPQLADAEIHVSVGDEDIERWRARDDEQELAMVDTRTPEERAEARRLKRDITESLTAAGRDDLVAQLDTARINLPDEGLPDAVKRQLNRLVEIDEPIAVFLASRS